MMSINKYQIFVKVAELGSLTRAAEALGYTQPAVSHSISSLESRFGFPLFCRSRDACTLTENGAQLLDACRQILRSEAEIEETVHALNGMLTGSIRIGSVSSMLTEFVPRVVYHFSRAYPQIRITLNELTFQEIPSALGAGASTLVSPVTICQRGASSASHRSSKIPSASFFLRDILSWPTSGSRQDF